MSHTRQLRWLLAAGTVLLTLLLLSFILLATRNLLDLWDRLRHLPAWLLFGYGAMIGLVVLAGGWAVYRLLWRSGRSDMRSASPAAAPVTEEALVKDIAQVEDAGLDTAEFKAELGRLAARKAAGQIHVAFFGDISTGKSSIIKALLPEAGVEIAPRGGTTREVREYAWTTGAGDRLLLTDLPGRNEAGGALDATARDEALRAQMVVYVAESDLSRGQFEDIRELTAYGKPVLIAVNKRDQYSEEEQVHIAGRIRERFSSIQSDAMVMPDIVFIQSGGEEEIIRVLPHGREEVARRPRPVDVSALAARIQDTIDHRLEWLNGLRDVSVFSLVRAKLDKSRDEFRCREGEKIVRDATRKAIVGALAAISPGSDLVIQGIIGTRMVRELCALYDCPVRQLDIDRFFDLSQDRLKKSVPLILAVAGNGLKAFPGLGTVAGGLVHAVAYGLIFDAMGHAVAQTLARRGSLKAAPAALTFQEMLRGNLEERARSFARLVADQNQRHDDG